MSQTLMLIGTRLGSGMVSGMVRGPETEKRTGIGIGIGRGMGRTIGKGRGTGRGIRVEIRLGARTKKMMETLLPSKGSATPIHTRVRYASSCPSLPIAREWARKSDEHQGGNHPISLE